MSNLVYLISSLPSLTFGQKPPIPMSEFLCNSKDQLSEKHYKMLEAVDMQAGIKRTCNSRLRRLVVMMDEFSEDISEIRKAKTHSRQPKLKRLPKTVTSGNPLEREQKIMQYQWEELVSFESGKTFTLTEVIMYKLKLQILHRMDSFNCKRGEQILESVISPSKKREIE